MNRSSRTGTRTRRRSPMTMPPRTLPWLRPNCSTRRTPWPTPTPMCLPTRGHGGAYAATAANSPSRRSRLTIYTTSSTTPTTSVIDWMQTVAHQREFGEAVYRHRIQILGLRPRPYGTGKAGGYSTESFEFGSRPRCFARRVRGLLLTCPAHRKRPICEVRGRRDRGPQLLRGSTHSARTGIRGLVCLLQLERAKL